MLSCPRRVTALSLASADVALAARAGRFHPARAGWNRQAFPRKRPAQLRPVPCCERVARNLIESHLPGSAASVT